MRNIFFAHSSSTPYYNLLEILNFDDIVKFKTAVFTHKILKKKDIPAIFSDFIIPEVDIPSHKTRYATKENCIEQAFAQTTANLCLGIRQFKWESVPSHLKFLTVPAFRKQHKTFLPSNQ